MIRNGQGIKDTESINLRTPSKHEETHDLFKIVQKFEGKLAEKNQRIR